MNTEEIKKRFNWSILRQLRFVDGKEVDPFSTWTTK